MSAVNLSDSSFGTAYHTAFGDPNQALITEPDATAYQQISGVLNNLEPIGLSIQMRGRLEVNGPAVEITDVERVTQRLTPQVVQTMPTPVIVDGLPLLPEYVATFPFNMTALQDPTHIMVVPDPDPVWDPDTGTWVYAPPSSGVGDTRWTVNDLADPNIPLVTATIGSQTQSVSGLLAGAYEYVVAAWDYPSTPTPALIKGQSSEGLPSAGSVLFQLPAPQLSLTIKLTWPSIAGATGYSIDRRYAPSLFGPPTGPYQLLAAEGASPTPTYIDDGSVTPALDAPPPLVDATATSLDGHYFITSWPASAPTVGPAWGSNSSFSPSVRAYAHLGPNGKRVRYPRAIQTDGEFTDTFWANFPGQTMPFSWVVVAIIKAFRPGALNYILDSGENPLAVGWPAGQSEGAESRNLNENYGYRVALAATSTTITATTDRANANLLQAPLLDNLKPKMFFGIYNTGTSRVGAWGVEGKHDQIGGLTDHGLSTKMVMGRANGILGRQFGSNMAVLEVRRWNHALNDAELQQQYAQLSATWQFAAFV